MDDSLLPPLTRVAVVGAGALGLAQIHQLIAAGVDRSKIVAYEARKEVGGLWTFEPEAGECEVRFSASGLAVPATKPERKDETLPPTALYETLRTNLPKTVMNFRERDFSSGADVFPVHQDVHSYLISYAEAFNLRSCIRFSTTVRRIFHSPEGQPRWSIESESNGVRFVEQFSHVVVANGHYTEPFIPYVPGLHQFKHQILHSRWWRTPKLFKGKKVLVVGSRASGGDISHDLSIQNLSLPPDSPHQATIYQSTRGALDEVFPKPLEEWTKQVHLLPRLDHVDEEGNLHFVNDKVIKSDEIDVVIFATGYNYSFPFVHPEDAPWTSNPITVPREGRAKEGELPSDKIDWSLRPRGGSQVDHLDESLQAYYLPDPSIAFIGLAYMVVPFRLTEVQARVVARSWVKKSLPKELPPLIHSGTPVEGNRHTIGYPAEYENADNWLKAIGEGGEDGPGWNATTEKWKTERVGAKELRKRKYGY